MCRECTTCVEERQPNTIKIKWGIININLSYRKIKNKACAEFYTNWNNEKLIVIPKSSRAKTFWNDHKIYDFLDPQIITHPINIYDDYLCCFI